MERITEHISSSNLRFYGESLESFSQLGGEGVTPHVAYCKKQITALFSGRKPFFFFVSGCRRTWHHCNWCWRLKLNSSWKHNYYNGFKRAAIGSPAACNVITSKYPFGNSNSHKPACTFRGHPQHFLIQLSEHHFVVLDLL